MKEVLLLLGEVSKVVLHKKKATKSDPKKNLFAPIHALIKGFKQTNENRILENRYFLKTLYTKKVAAQNQQKFVKD